MADAAGSLLQELKAQPRKENLEVARAQVELATASLKSAQDTLNKQQHSYDLEPRSVSKETLDTVRNSVKVAKANLDVVSPSVRTHQGRSLDLRHSESKAGRVDALSKAWSASHGASLRQVHGSRADGWCGPFDSGCPRQLRVFAGCLWHLHAGPRANHRHGHWQIQRIHERALLR